MLGLVAAAALLIDYVMTVAVSTSSAVEQLISINPDLNSFRIGIALASIALITIGNLRGLRESGQHLRGPDLPVRGPRAADRGDRRVPDRVRDGGSPAAPARGRCRWAPRHRHPAADEGVRERLGRADRHRGDRQRRAGVQAARGEERGQHAGRDGGAARRSCSSGSRSSPTPTRSSRRRRARAARRSSRSSPRRRSAPAARCSTCSRSARR